MSLERQHALTDGGFDHVARDDRQDARAQSSGALVRHEFVDIARVFQFVSTGLFVTNVRDAECHFSAGVGFDVPCKRLNFRLASLVAQLADTELNVAPLLSDCLSEADARSLDVGAATRVGVDCGFRQLRSAASVEDSIHRLALIARIHAGNHKRGLDFCHGASTVSGLRGRRYGIAGCGRAEGIEACYNIVCHFLTTPI